jgi:hypothetical protein
MYKRALAIVGVVLIALMLFAPAMAFAADSEEESTTSSVTVSTIVDITLSKAQNTSHY